jgi:hypothetical protein
MGDGKAAKKVTGPVFAKNLGEEEGLGRGLVLMSWIRAGAWEFAIPEKERAVPRERRPKRSIKRARICQQDVWSTIVHSDERIRNLGERQRKKGWEFRF